MTHYMQHIHLRGSGIGINTKTDKLNTENEKRLTPPPQLFHFPGLRLRIGEVILKATFTQMKDPPNQACS